MIGDEEKGMRELRIAAASSNPISAAWFGLYYGLVFFFYIWLAGFIGGSLGLKEPLSWLVYPVLALIFAFLYYRGYKFVKPYREREEKARYRKYNRMIAREDRIIAGEDVPFPSK